MKLFDSGMHVAQGIPIFLLVFAFATTAGAVTVIDPGQSVVLEVGDDLTCQETLAGLPEGDFPLTGNCLTIDRHLDIFAYAGGSSVGLDAAQRAAVTARLIHEIEIPTAPEGSSVEVLPVQIATEVSWSGVLLAIGFNSAFAQVIATLQVRDVASGLVVASDTFFFERLDADLSLDALDAFDAVDITNSSGTDITALLLRGRTYSIELEAKCDVRVPLIGAAVCSFFDNAEDLGIPLIEDLFGGDGFDVASVTVSVGTDVVAHIAEN